MRNNLDAKNAKLEKIDSDSFNMILFQAYKKNDIFSKILISTSIKYIAQILDAYIISSAPDVIIVRGRIALNVGDDYIKLSTKELKERNLFWLH